MYNIVFTSLELRNLFKQFKRKYINVFHTLRPIFNMNILYDFLADNAIILE